MTDPIPGTAHELVTCAVRHDAEPVIRLEIREFGPHSDPTSVDLMPTDALALLHRLADALYDARGEQR